MTIDKARLKELVESVTTDRRFCADEHHHELATGVSALLSEISRIEIDAAYVMAGSRTRSEVIDQLKAENEALRKDAERYRWLRDKQTFIWLIQDWFPGEAMLTNVDADIDAAMAKEAGHG